MLCARVCRPDHASRGKNIYFCRPVAVDMVSAIESCVWHRTNNPDTCMDGWLARVYLAKLGKESCGQSLPDALLRNNDTSFCVCLHTVLGRLPRRTFEIRSYVSGL